MNAHRSVWLAEGQFNLTFTAGRQIWERDFLLFQRDAGLIEGDGAQVIPAKSVGGKIVPRLHQDAD